MKRIGTRTLAVAALVTFAASGCGASETAGAGSGVVALQAADDAPGDAHGGKGGEGGHGDVPGEPGRDGAGSGREKAGTATPAPSDDSRKSLKPYPVEQYLGGRDGEARLPDQSAKDWVTYADHVAVVTVVREWDRGPDKHQLEVGEGMWSRTVLLRVDDVIWSSKAPAQPAPKEFRVGAWGWTFKNHRPDLRRPFSNSDTPRMEMGHSYVMALAWDGPRCGEDGNKLPGRWNSLGSDSMIPFDDGVLGQGELGGYQQDPAVAKATLAAQPFPSLEDKMLTRSAADLQAALDAARPGERNQGFYPKWPCAD